MDAHATVDIRNVVLVGPTNAGKTLLAEALLAHAGAISRLGAIEDGTTVCDGEPEEQDVGHSLTMALASFDLDGHRVNLIDQPGGAEFDGTMSAALDVADLAVLVVSAADPVGPLVADLWSDLAERQVPRLVFVNKLDREGASYPRTLDGLASMVGAGLAPVELPIGDPPSAAPSGATQPSGPGRARVGLAGVADVLHDTAYLYTPDGPMGASNGSGPAARHHRPSAGPTITQADIPAWLAEAEEQEHHQLVEGIVLADDQLLERYLEGQEPSAQELERTLARGLDLATVFPVLCGSALRQVGVDRLADFISRLGPSPLDRSAPKVQAGPDQVEVAPDAGGAPLAVVFHTVVDPYVGQISLFKVLSGTVTPGTHLFNPRTGTEERFGTLFAMCGQQRRDVDSLVAGDIGAVTKLSATSTGDTLAPRATPVQVVATPTPEPLLATAIVPRSATDDDKLALALQRLQEQDRCLQVEHDEETGQTLLWGQGDLHLQVSIARLSRMFGVHVDREEVRIPYRETITTPAQAEGRYKKQSGGHGQFGVVVLRIEPRERGAGFEFVDQVTGGAIPHQFMTAVAHGAREAMARGGLHGYPVVDVRVVCLDGKHHVVDSSDMSFRMAARLAVAAAFDQADPVVLEPVSLLEVRVPAESAGDVIGDLNSRRAQVQGIDAVDPEHHVITALVPRAEVRHYAVDLRAHTSGRGRFHAEPHHYEPLPPQVVVSDRPASLAGRVDG